MQDNVVWVTYCNTNLYVSWRTN